MTPQKRLRTQKQLDQKRVVDRIKHKENREEHNRWMTRMESEISGLLKDLQSIASQLSEVSQTIDSTTFCPSSWPFFGPPASMITGTEDMGTLVRLNPPIHSGITLSPRSSLPLPPLVDCRCGVFHIDPSDCLEYCSFTILLETHTSFSQNPRQSCHLPRDPTLPDFMLNSSGDNPLTWIITSILKKANVSNVPTLFGLYLFAYRLMRWRLYPDESTMKDVPPWLLPTEAQQTYPHPVSIDYIPWPPLRTYLCMNQNTDSRQKVNIYMESLTLKWPPYSPLIVMGDSDQLRLNPEFEQVVFNLKNWRLGQPWLSLFPHLVPLVS